MAFLLRDGCAISVVPARMPNGINLLLDGCAISIVSARMPNGINLLRDDFYICFGKDAEWHVLPSSGGVTADFFTPCREKMRHGGEKLPYERKFLTKQKSPPN